MSIREQRAYTDEPTYWFAILEIARERGDSASAMRAQRELRRLGIVVRHQSKRANRLSPSGHQRAAR